jgi:hypothetical protein
MQAAVALNVRRRIYPKGTTKLQPRNITYLEGLYEAAEYAYFSYEDINMPYDEWWERRGHLVFDSATNQAVVRDLGTIDISNIKESTKGVNDAVKTLATDKSSRLHMLVTIPMFMSYKDATSQLDLLLKTNLLGLSKQPRIRKKLHGKRHHDKPLLKKLKLMMYKAMYPELTLIELGIKANISSSNDRILRSKDFTAEQKSDARRAIGLTASRALLMAEYISERAARDQFPYSGRTPSLGIDWKQSRKNLLKAWPNLKG